MESQSDAGPFRSLASYTQYKSLLKLAKRKSAFAFMYVFYRIPYISRNSVEYIHESGPDQNVLKRELGQCLSNIT